MRLQMRNFVLETAHGATRSAFRRVVPIVRANDEALPAQERCQHRVPQGQSPLELAVQPDFGPAALLRAQETNGKVERFIQSALREWAYGWTYRNSADRTEALARWQHHYNWHRPRSSIGFIAPMNRLKPANNLLTVHT